MWYAAAVPSGQHALAAGPAGCVCSCRSPLCAPALITEPGGAKLAKSRRSVALDPAQRGRSCRKPSPCWARNLQLRLSSSHPKRVVDWGCAHWDLDRFQGVRQVRATHRSCLRVRSVAFPVGSRAMYMVMQTAKVQQPIVRDLS